MLYAEIEYSSELDTIEANLNVIVSVGDMLEATKGRARRLYAILSGLLKGRPLVMLRAVEPSNGFELWRQLVSVYAPRTRARGLALLSAFMGYPGFTKDRSFREQINALERIADEYNKVSGQTITGDVRLGVLARVLPAHLRQHVQLQMTETSTYDSVREAVLSYESVTTTWSASRVHMELGVGQDSGGPAPMDISRINEDGKGKGKGKGKHNKGKGKGGKGKGKQSKGKGKGGNQANGRGGKGAGKGRGGKGRGKGRGKNPNECLACGEIGHWKRDCPNAMQVNQLTAGAQSTQQAQVQVSSAVPRQAASKASAHPPANVRRVEFGHPEVFHFPQDDVVNLTIYDVSDELGSGDLESSNSWAIEDWSSIRMLSRVGRQVRSLEHGQVEIILDSGADTSALPVSMAGLGVSVQDPRNQASFSDVQGNPLAVQDTRLCEVTIGGGLKFLERFVIANVTSPLVCLGKLYRAGWYVKPGQDGLCLTDGTTQLRVDYRHQSFATTGVIRMLSQAEVRQLSQNSNNPLQV